METQIQKLLCEIEEKENCQILLAVESGSRAWGFASPDSDYDVRFLYVRPKESYLRLERVRDVIELPISDLLDINGWDLAKMLRLLHGSNPTVFEWFSSPIVYKTTPFADALMPILQRYFLSRKGLWHYLRMAERNYQEHLCREQVRAKKYFYVLRPILACRWILATGTPPPMLFSELVASQLPAEMLPAVQALLDLKQNASEIQLIPRNDFLNTYIEQSLTELRQAVESYPREPCRDWTELNQIFLSALNA